jgi:hypothetical protein
MGLLALGQLRIAQAGLWMEDYLQGGLRAMGWYDHRRPLQVACIMAFAVSFWTVLRRAPLRPITGLTFAIGSFYMLVVLTAIRTSSLHWTDAFLRQHLGSLTFSEALQLLLVTVISATTVRLVFRKELKKQW